MKREDEFDGLQPRARLAFLNDDKIIDTAFLVFCAGLAIYHFVSISSIELPTWDAAGFLANFRPPLLSWVISGVWTVTGENCIAVKYLPAFFTMATAVLLYLVKKKHKGSVFSMCVTSITMLNSQVLFWGEQLMSESLSLLFLVLSLYLVKSEKPHHWFLGGITDFDSHLNSSAGAPHSSYSARDGVSAHAPGSLRFRACGNRSRRLLH